MWIPDSHNRVAYNVEILLKMVVGVQEDTLLP